MSSLNSSSSTSSSQKKNFIPSSSSGEIISPLRKNKENNVKVESLPEVQSLSDKIQVLSQDIECTKIEIFHVQQTIETSKEIKGIFNQMKEENIFSNNLFKAEEYYFKMIKKFEQYRDILLQLNETSELEKNMIERISDLNELYEPTKLTEKEAQNIVKKFLSLQDQCSRLVKKKISLHRDYVRIFAKDHKPSFPLEASIIKYAITNKNRNKTEHLSNVSRYVDAYNYVKLCILKINSAISHTIVSAPKARDMLISQFENETFLPLWDEEVPEIKEFPNLKELEKYGTPDVLDKLPDSLEKRFFINVKANIDYNIQTLEEKALQCSNDMMILLLQEEEKEKQKQHISLSALSISPKQEFISTIQQDDNEVSENISETGVSSKPLPEEDYNQKLQAQWKNYFKNTDYRKGHWSGKGGILIPVMENNFSPQMRFMLSANTVMEHLKKRHPDVIQTLSRAKKGKIKDKDGFEPVISTYKQDIHNLIFDLALQLSDKETLIYKSEFYIHPETHEKIPNPTIMVRGKNKAGDIMLSAWGLYEAEKSDNIKLHLVSYYKDNNPNKKLPHAMKISKFADKIHQETEADTSKKLTDEDAELIALFADGEVLQKTKAQFEQIKKGKGKKKKS